MDALVWKNWDPPKDKLSAWLIIQNPDWTTDRLERRGWPNGRLCPLCRCEDETTRHLLFTCRYSIHIWGMIKDGLGIDDFNPSEWATFSDVQSWCEHLSLAHGTRRKAMPSLIMFVSMAIWNECNARVFKQTSALPLIIFARIRKSEGTL